MRPSLYFSPYSKHTVDILVDWHKATCQPLGLICSTGQVNVDGGYTGFTQESLREYVGPDAYIGRDHLGKSEDLAKATKMLNDDIGHFNYAHIQLEDLRDVGAIMSQFNGCIRWEIGPGECEMKHWDPFDYCEAVLSECKPADVFGFAFPTGCKIDETHNLERINASLIEEFKGLGYPLKGHNSDYCSEATLHRLAEFGIDSLNVAPQLGVIMTRAYCDYARVFGYDLSEWEDIVMRGGEWQRWGRERYAVELGGQYHFNELPDGYTERANVFVSMSVNAMLCYYHRNFTERKPL